MNKRGDERVLAIWMFFIFFIIFVAFSIMVSMFYSQQVDIREIQADILSSRINKCLDSLISLDDNLNKVCNIADLNGNFYYNVSFYHDENYVQSFFNGNRDFEIQCSLKGNNFAKCFSVGRKLSLDKDYDVIIFTGSNFIGEEI